ncbi:MAG TPA: serine hydrolase domain-containing protein [Acidimicrobiia bacterium]|nr:serine hydrolase domain-containing protein [Acidimicrobiia bacterium]
MTHAVFDRRPVDDPADLGIDRTAFAELCARVQRDIDEGRVPSCQIALARDGKLAVWRSFGDALPQSRYVIFSATKPVVAGAIWILIGDDQLDISRRVAEIVPEFASNGKDVVTIEQVLLHTSGFPHAPFDPLDWDDRERRLARFAQWRLNWEPGTRFEYHPTAAHWVLAEIIERCTGTDFRVFVRERILEPLGLVGLQVGVPAAEQGDINALVLTGEPASPDELEAVLGVRSLPITEVTPEALLRFNRADVRAVGVPGGGGVSTAADLALYYQAVLRDSTGSGPGIWSRGVLADATARVRNRMPDYVGTPANRTIGLVVAGDDGRSGARGLGKTVSARAFGHNGAGGQIAWADPETGLSFCYLTNGLDQHQLREWRRTTAIASRAAVCPGARGT